MWRSYRPTSASTSSGEWRPDSPAAKRVRARRVDPARPLPVRGDLLSTLRSFHARKSRPTRPSTRSTQKVLFLVGMMVPSRVSVAHHLGRGVTGELVGAMFSQDAVPDVSTSHWFWARPQWQKPREASPAEPPFRSRRSGPEILMLTCRSPIAEPGFIGPNRGPSAVKSGTVNVPCNDRSSSR